MKDKKWGEYAYLVVTQRKSSSLHDYRNAEITVESVKVRTVGRQYITLDDPHGTRFDMETRLENKDWGAKREIYPTREEAEEVAQRMRLMNRMIGYLAFDGQKQCEKLSLTKLQLLHDILTQEPPGDVPDTGYISRKSAIEAILGEPADAHYPGWYADIIKRIPVARVIKPRRGKWLYVSGKGRYAEYECSECRAHVCFDEKIDGTIPKYKGCPHCLAEMDGGDCNV